jgi:hypothetical protein
MIGYILFVPFWLWLKWQQLVLKVKRWLRNTRAR